MNTLTHFLWLASLGVYGAVLWYKWTQLRAPFAFPAWKRAWGELVAAKSLFVLRRLVTIQGFLLMPEGLALLDAVLLITCGVLELYGFRSLVSIFHGELPTYRPPEAEIICDANSVILSWNAHATTLFGFTAEEAIGQTLMKTIMPSRNWEAHRAGIARFMATRTPEQSLAISLTLSALHKDQTEVDIRLNVGMFLVDGEVRFIGKAHRLVLV